MIKPTQDKMAILTDEEMRRAWDDAFDTPLNLAHYPTADDIINHRIKMVAQAQIAKLDKRGYESNK